jgi:hypothetical protein
MSRRFTSSGEDVHSGMARLKYGEGRPLSRTHKYLRMIGIGRTDRTDGSEHDDAQ